MAAMLAHIEKPDITTLDILLELGMKSGSFATGLSRLNRPVTDASRRDHARKTRVRRGLRR